MKAIVFLLATLLITSCAGGFEQSESPTTLASSDQISAAPLPDIYSNGISKQIKKAHYRFQAKDVKVTLEAIESSLRKFPAYISSSSLTLENPIMESRVTIKVRNEYFDELLKQIDQQAVFVNFRNITTEDVSKEFVDLESRLTAKREVEARLMNILRNKAGTVKDVLEAEKQIGDLHEEIEAVISRINFLKDQVKYSTIDLEIYQTITEVISSSEETFGDRMKNGLRAGLDGVESIVVGLVYVWPLLLVGAIAGLWFKKRKAFI